MSATEATATTSAHVSALLADHAKDDSNSVWISCEFFPPKTEEGVKNLYKLAEKLKKYNPLFGDVTWGAGGSTSDLTFELCVNLKEKIGMNPNMHLTCTNMERQKVVDALDSCKKAGITNIVALRGDPPAGQAAWEAVEGGFTCALDLVKFIRQEHGDYFCLSVAGYPEGHPSKMTKVEDVSAMSSSEAARSSSFFNEEAGVEETFVCKDEDFEKELDYLKQKVDAGANCIITQLFFDVDVFITFVEQCRKRGIEVPILPGIMCINSAGGFGRMTMFCKTRVPKEMAAVVSKIADDDAVGMKAFGVRYITEMCEALIAKGVSGLHFYTLNTGFVAEGVIKNLAATHKIYGYVKESTERAEGSVVGTVAAAAGAVAAAQDTVFDATVQKLASV